MLMQAIRVIEAHDLLGLAAEIPNFAIPNREESAEASPANRAVPLSQMWHRGRFEPSLFADSSARSRLWRDEAIRDELASIEKQCEIPHHGLAFWQAIARRNGCDIRGIQQKSRLAKEAFNRLVDHCVERGLLFRLEEWVSAPGGQTPRQLLYWSDPGVLNHLLGLREEVLVDWQGMQTAEERSQREFVRGKSWEGFAISTLLRATKASARGRFWQVPEGEIDLILDWNESDEKWAIEMATGRRKRVSGGFADGCRMTNADRAAVVYPSGQDMPMLKGAAKVPIGIERFTLEAALKAVLEGP